MASVSSHCATWRRAEHGVVDGSPFVTGQAPLQRGQRRHRAGQPDEQASRASAREPRRGPDQLGVHHAPGPVQLVGERRVVVEEPLGHPDAADVERHGGHRVGRQRRRRAEPSGGELGRPSADVDHEHGTGTDAFVGDVRGGTGERERTLLETAQHLGVHPGDAFGRRQESSRVGGVTDRRGGHQARPPDPVEVHEPAVVPQDRHGARQRLG